MGKFQLNMTFLLSFLKEEKGAREKQCYCGEGKTALAEICIDGCGSVNKNSRSNITNWFDVRNC